MMYLLVSKSVSFSPMVTNYVSTKLYSYLFNLKLTKNDLIRLKKSLTKIGEIDELLVKA